MPDLLLELFSEEIPARMQAKAADDLRRQVDAFIDLVELQARIGRDPSERAIPRTPGATGAYRRTRAASGRTSRSAVSR